MKPLSQDAVRGLLLAAQGLEPRRKAKTTQADVQAIIRQMHVLQIDTIHVIARSPYLVLWSRLGDYDPRWLDALLAEGQLFEYWSHAACFLPIEDFPLYRPKMLRRLDTENDPARWQEWLEVNRSVVNDVLQRVQMFGAVRSSDFERTDGEKGTWWNWKAEKVALEYLLDVGELMIAKRHNFQRIYDLRARVLPDWDDSRVASDETVIDTFVLHTLKALGVTKKEWVADYFRIRQAEASAALKRLEKRDHLLRVPVVGWDEPGYAHPDHTDRIEKAAKGSIPQARTTLLSPFDPVVWDRKRGLDLFSFDYKIECYTPAPKRKYGYFTLPILHNNHVIGRLDPKAHRQDGIFEVKALHLEPHVQVDDGLIARVRQAIQDCAAWHQTPQVVVRWCNVPGLATLLADET
jgi:uncharacterized protein